MKIALALLIIAPLLLGLIRLVRWRLGHFDAPDDGAGQLADPDPYLAAQVRAALHPFKPEEMPIGATPEALREGE